MTSTADLRRLADRVRAATEPFPVGPVTMTMGADPDDVRALASAILELLDRLERAEFMVQNRYIVRRMSDTGMWMVLSHDGYPITGGEYTNEIAAINACQSQAAIDQALREAAK